MLARFEFVSSWYPRPEFDFDAMRMERNM
jgi:hypothetical protein